MKRHVVIVGAGFAGLELAALELPFRDFRGDVKLHGVHVSWATDETVFIQRVSPADEEQKRRVRGDELVGRAPDAHGWTVLAARFDGGHIKRVGLGGRRLRRRLTGRRFTCNRNKRDSDGESECAAEIAVR